MRLGTLALMPENKRPWTPVDIDPASDRPKIIFERDDFVG